MDEDSVRKALEKFRIQLGNESKIVIMPLEKRLLIRTDLKEAILIEALFEMLGRGLDLNQPIQPPGT